MQWHKSVQPHNGVQYKFKLKTYFTHHHRSYSYLNYYTLLKYTKRWQQQGRKTNVEKHTLMWDCELHAAFELHTVDNLFRIFPMLWDLFFQESGTMQSPLASNTVPWTIRWALVHFSKYSQALWMWGAICYHEQWVIPFWISVWICEAAKLTHILLFTCRKGIISLEKFSRSGADV